MQYVRVEHDGEGGSRFVDVPIEHQESFVVAGVPPLLLSDPVPVQAVVFVEVPPEVRDTEPHPPPRRQFVVVLSGVLEIETSGGEIRHFRPGEILLAEDLDGVGHISRVAEPPLRALFIPAGP
jgi:quercetin dioxygenase-like cupin family protein